MDASKITIEIHEKTADGVLAGKELVVVVCKITEPTSGLDASDLILPDGLSATAITYSYSTWTDDSQYLREIDFELEVSDDFFSTGNVITLSASSYTFKSAAASFDVSSSSFNIKSTHPTVTITVEGDLSKPLTSTTGVGLTFMFSESVSGFTQSDILTTTGAGVISGFQKVSSSKYTAIFTPNESTHLSDCAVYMMSLTYGDQFGNPGNGAESASFSIDTQDISPPAPTITLSSGVSLADGIDITISFLEAVTGFDKSDIQWIASDGSLTPTSAVDDGKIFTFHYSPGTYWPAGGGSAQIQVTAGGYTDLAGNTGLASEIKTFNVDVKSPTPLIIFSDQELTSNETCKIDLIFNESVKGFSLSNLSVSQAVGTLDQFQIHDSLGQVYYSVIFTPRSGLEQSAVKILVDGGYTDIAGNSAISTASPVFSIDTLAPRASIILADGADTQLISGESLKLMLTFTEAVKNFDLSDLSLNLAAGLLDNFKQEDMQGKIYSVILTPQPGIEKSGIVMRLNGDYTDLVGNPGLETQSPELFIDTLAPQVAITLVDTAHSQLISGESLKLLLTFTEAVKNFDLSNLGLSQPVGMLDNFQQEDAEGKVYSVILTPQSGIEKSGVTMLLNGDYTDMAGNLGTGAASPALSIDTLAPCASITVGDTHLTRGESTLLSFTFTEAVSDFAAGDVRLDGAAVSLTQFTEVEAGKKFTALYTPPAEIIDANNIFSIEAGSYTDLAGNLGEAAQSDNVSIDTVGKILFGTTGSDAIVGTAGADRISGLPQSGAGAGKDSSDLLLGLSGADIFVLGNHTTAFYNDGNNSTAGTKDFAAIGDFSVADGDTIEVKAGTYFFSALTVGKLSGAGLYLDTNNSGAWDAKDELIGFLVGVNPGSVSATHDLMPV